MVLDNLLGGALNSIGMLPVEHNGQKQDAARCLESAASLAATIERP
jgi:hypothetical protein